jgi:CheY-like chemotaxis protein
MNDAFDNTPRQRTKMGILVVDDDDGVRTMLGMWLRQQGFTVWDAGSGRQAITLFEEHGDTIHAVLTDVQMPDMDGPQTVSTLLGKYGLRVPCCFMSADLGDYTEEVLYSMGAAAILRKPFRLEQVVRLLGDLLTPPNQERAIQGNRWCDADGQDESNGRSTTAT